MTYTPYLDWIDGQAAAMETRLLAWAEINSGSRNRDGLVRMCTALEEAFAPLADETEVLSLPPLREIADDGAVKEVPLGPALRIVKRPDAARRVLLVGHMDTVYGANHPFQSCRDLGDGRINGPGVADLKGGLVVMLAALQAFENSPYADRLGWEVLINPDEEIGSPGSAPLLARSAAAADVGLVFEPSLPDGTLVGARKGSGNFTVVVRGRAAHAGREHHLGRNAVAALARGVAAIDGLNGARPNVTFNVGRMVGGGPVNVLPDLALARLNVRMAAAEDTAWIEGELARIVAELDAAEGFSASLSGGFSRPPKPMNPGVQGLFDFLKDCGGALGLDLGLRSTGGCCDGNNLAAAGLPNIDTLGVRGGQIHSIDEFVILESLVERARLSALALMRMAAGEFDWPARPRQPELESVK